jgi:hypothetical protein
VAKLNCVDCSSVYGHSSSKTERCVRECAIRSPNASNLSHLSSIKPNCEPPIGLILCSEKSREEIELLQLDEGEIRVAEYMTALPPRALLEQKFRDAIKQAHDSAVFPHDNSG